MESFRIKKRSVFDLISVSSDSSISVEGKGLEDEQSSNHCNELVRPVNIEMILKAARNTQFSQAGRFVSARVEEVGLPGHPDFIPKFLNFERRNFCFRWSCIVATQMVSAWQQGETGRSDGFYSEEELGVYKVK
jgi:hypothetical protein